MRWSDPSAFVILATALTGCGVYGPPVRASDDASAPVAAAAAAEATAEPDDAGAGTQESSP